MSGYQVSTRERNKTRAFDLLRAKGAVKAVLDFSGGNDEGGVNEITIVFPPPAEGLEPLTQDLEVYYGGVEYERINGEWKPKPKTQMTQDQELSVLLQEPVDDEFGTWAGDFEAYGTLTWDVKTGKCEMEKFVQSGYDYEREEW